LLIFSHPEDADQLLDTLQNERISAVRIGFTTSQSDHLLTVV
jgi:hypothetical protein